MLKQILVLKQLYEIGPQMWALSMSVHAANHRAFGVQRRAPPTDRARKGHTLYRLTCVTTGNHPNHRHDCARQRHMTEAHLLGHSTDGLLMAVKPSKWQRIIKSFSGTSSSEEDCCITLLLHVIVKGMYNTSWEKIEISPI